MMYLPQKQIYRFDGIELDLSRGSLLLNGVERHLRQKAFQVLVYLIERRERLVSKDELFEAVWRDSAVTDDALVQCVKEIRRALGDDTRQPRFIKTLPKSGYRFIGAVDDDLNGTYSEEITRVEFEIEEQIENSGQAGAAASILGRTTRRGAFYYAVAGFLVICAVAAVALYVSRSDLQQWSVRLLPAAGKKSVAVMFFDNRSGQEDLEWLREGLADMLITNLSRSEKLTVLSRQQLQLLLERTGYTSGSDVDIEKALAVAQKSGAENVVVGSIFRLGDKIRLDVQLHDGTTGDLKGAESLTVESPEQMLTDIDLLSFRLARRLTGDGQIPEANIAAAMTNNLEAYRFYSLALEKAQGLHKTETLELLEKAVELDPEFAMAHARIGHTYAITWGWADKAKPHLERAFSLSDRLSEKDKLNISAWYSIANLDYPSAIGYFREIIARYPLETEAYVRLGSLLRGEEQFDEAISVMRQGLVVDPESPALFNSLGLLYSLLGRHDDAIAMHERYVALAPNEANARDSLGMSYQWAGRYDEAIAEYQRALEMNPRFEIAYAHLGVAYFQTGRYLTAIDWFNKYIVVAPSTLEKGRGLSYIAHVYRKKKDRDRAARTAQRAVDLNGLYVWEAVVAALDRRDWNTVRKHEKNLFAPPKFTNRGSRGAKRDHHYYRGFLAIRSGQTDTAIAEFKETLSHAPSTWDIDSFEDCLANAYMETGQYSEAIEEYLRILRLNPKYPLAHYQIAKAFDAQGKADDARAWYSDFLQIWSAADNDLPEILAAKRYLQDVKS